MECAPRKNEQPPSYAQSNLEVLKKYNKEAYRFIDEALNQEDRGNIREAQLCYEKGLRSIDAALKFSNGTSKLDPESEKEYIILLDKIERTQREVKLRIQTITGTKENGAAHQECSRMPSAPPLADTCNISSNSRPSNENQTNTWQDVKELLSIKEGVQLFHVNENGAVSPWTSPCSLEIFQIIKEGCDGSSPAAFIKCGEWLYPMEPGQSPVLKSKDKTYMFPDVPMDSSLSSGLSCVGVVLSQLVPDVLVTRFERVLSCYANFRKEEEGTAKEKPPRPPPPSKGASQTKPNDASTNIEQITAKPAIESSVEHYSGDDAAPKPPWVDRISEGINVGSQWVSWGLIKGAEYTGVLVGKGANALRERLIPNEQPTSVDPEVSNNIRQLQQATGSVVQVSAFLVNALGTMTYNLGKKVAPHVVHQGNRILPQKYKLENNQSSQKKYEDAKKIAASGLGGLAMIFLSLEQAGKNLYQSVSNATVQTLTHKYGDEVGDVSQDAMGAAGNAVMAYWNIQRLGPKAIAKRAVKDTGKAIVMEDHDVVVTKPC